MAADREVLREFLVSLGFRIDEVGAKRFVNSILNVTKTAGKASATIAGVAVAAEAMVRAGSTRKLLMRCTAETC